MGQGKSGLIASERIPHLTNRLLGDPRVDHQEWVLREHMVAFAGYPLTVDDRVVGVMALFARQWLADDTGASTPSSYRSGRGRIGVWRIMRKGCPGRISQPGDCGSSSSRTKTCSGTFSA